MKAILKFNLPEDNIDYIRAAKATDLALVIWEFKINSRSYFEGEEYDQRSIDAVFNLFNSLCDDHHVDIEELII